MTRDTYDLPVPGVCPHCKSLDIDTGATGLDLCNQCGGLSRNGRPASEPEPQPVYVEEGWWSPNVKAGHVHQHKESQPATMHRECEPVYTRRDPRTGRPA